MKRKALCSLLALLLVLNMSVKGAASEIGGTIRVNWDGEGGELVLFPVGTWSQDGFLLAESCGGGFIKEEDVHSQALAQWLAESVEGEGRYRLIGEEGTVLYSSVPDGLYLLLQTETGENGRHMEPFLIPMPYDGTWEIQVNPRAEDLPPTGQGPEPFLGLAGMVLSGLGLAVCYWRRKKYV